MCIYIFFNAFLFAIRWTIVTEMNASRSAAGVTVFEGRIFVSGGHDGLQIFNTVSERHSSHTFLKCVFINEHMYRRNAQKYSV